MRNEFMLRLWYMAKRHNLTMPYPTLMEVPYQSTIPTPEERQATHLQALRSLAGFSSLPGEVLDKVVNRCQERDYAEHEVVLEIDMLQKTLAQSSRLAHDLGEVMEIRRRAIQSVKDVA